MPIDVRWCIIALKSVDTDYDKGMTPLDIYGQQVIDNDCDY